MKKYKDALIIFVLFPFGFFLTIMLLPRHSEVVYNCDIAEISPDIPLKVKEECRKLNIERHRNDTT